MNDVKLKELGALQLLSLESANNSSTPEQFAQLVEAKPVTWARVVREAAIRAE